MSYISLLLDYSSDGFVNERSRYPCFASKTFDFIQITWGWIASVSEIPFTSHWFPDISFYLVFCSLHYDLLNSLFSLKEGQRQNNSRQKVIITNNHEGRFDKQSTHKNSNHFCFFQCSQHQNTLQSRNSITYKRRSGIFQLDQGEFH